VTKFQNCPNELITMNTERFMHACFDGTSVKIDSDSRTKFHKVYMRNQKRFELHICNIYMRADMDTLNE